MFGLMGSGRTELARMIFGLDSFERGMVIVDGKAQSSFSPENCIRQGMAFVTEDRREEGLLMEATVVDNVSLVSLREYKRRIGLGVVDKNRIRGSVQDVVKRLQIKSGPIERDLAKNLSGGNQQKVVISKWLMSKPSVFIMDEPTRGIDVGSKYEIYSIIDDLAAQGAGILFISGELEELMGNCDRILVMSKGEIQGHFDREEFDEKQILHAAFKGHREHVAADER
jgi:ribose transport system ATP-binding protein